MKLSISMTYRETLLGWSYLLVSMFVLPFVFALINGFLNTPLSAAELNLIYFGINFVATLVIFHGFVYASFLEAKEHLWKCLKFALFGFLLYRGGSILLAAVTLLLRPDFSNVNDESLMGLFQEYPALLHFATVFLVPVYEELFYRGLVFQGLQRKNRLLAYCLSAGVFSAIHVFGYIGQCDLLTLVLCYLQYVPAGLALAWAYEKSNTIVAPILMHITINQIGMSAMR